MLRKRPLWWHENSLFALLTASRGVSLGYRGHKDEQTLRSRAGNVGHVAAENSGACADERLRGQSAVKAGVWRHFAGERRIALPSAAQAGARGLDHGGVENIRAWSADEILFADAAGPRRLETEADNCGAGCRARFRG